MGVTVVVPAFERSHHLRLTLQSILNYPAEDWLQIILIDDGGTPEIKAVADEFPEAQYVRLDREGRWKNPGRALNVGLRLAKGLVTIIQHSGIVARPGALERIVELVEADNYSAVLARIEENGHEVCGSFRPYFLLGGMMTEHFKAIRGYDEDFTEYGYEDDDLAIRLGAMGIRFDHRQDIVGEHMPHGRHDLAGEMERMRTLHYRKIEELRAGQIDLVRNKDREWGAL